MDFNLISSIMPIMFIVILAITGCVFIFVMINMFSPKARGKMMSKQIEAMKHMTDYSKDDLESMMTSLGNVSANVQNNIITQNEDILRNVATKQADINKEAVKTTVSAIREGFTGESNSTIFCKHCGSVIDADSKFCKKCGKEQ